MLIQISIKNFAIIEKMNIDFERGLTIITGQTGAGKSIVIDAIEQLLGQRASSNLVGSHDSLATIEGVFETNEKIMAYLSDLDMEIDDDIIIINKKIYHDGKSQLRLNNKIITLDIVKNLAPLLIEIISQNSAVYLNSPTNQLQYINSFFTAPEQDLLLAYQKEYREYTSLLSEYNNFITKQVDENLLEYYQGQLSDIEANYLSEEELAELNEKENYYNKFEAISENLNNIIRLFKNSNVLDTIYELTTLTAKTKDISESFKKIDEELNNDYYNLNNSYTSLVDELKTLNYDEEELSIIKNKLFNYQIMAKKYSYSTKIISDTKNDLIKKIDFIKNSAAIKDNYQGRINSIKESLLTKAAKLSEIRAKYITEVEIQIMKQLTNLYLNNAKFRIALKETELNNNGGDAIEFLFSANKGVALKAMNTIASGGELSRLLLALISIKMHKDDILYIFDEIDSGVSGEVADAIGKRMKALAQHNNIIAITHLAQVAAYADNHLYIEKDNTKNITASNCYYLDNNEKIIEIAKMISGNEVTELGIVHAEELINHAKQ